MTPSHFDRSRIFTRQQENRVRVHQRVAVSTVAGAFLAATIGTYPAIFFLTLTLGLSYGAFLRTRKRLANRLRQLDRRGRNLLPEPQPEESTAWHD
jgi:hypothetical protein